MKGQYRKEIAILLVLVLCITGLYRFDYVKADEGASPSFTGISDTNDAAMKLAEQLVGDNIKIENARLIGDANAFGTFENAYDIVGFPSGIVLATGNLNTNHIFGDGYAYFMEGELNNPKLPISEEDAKKYGFYEEGDYPCDIQNPDIDPDTRAYYEPAILEFEIIPETDTLSFQYMVASEEYPEYIEQFWDKFVLCVNDVNYALLPDKNETITIGNINPDKNPEYYRGLTIKDGILIEKAKEAGGDIDKVEECFNTTNAISADHFIFDGATKVFSVDALVNKGASNTIRLAIADYSDDLYDSAVFIKANSIKSKPALYGNIHIKHVDNKEGIIYLERRGGYVGAVSVDIKFLGQDYSELCNSQIIEFKDGEYLQAFSLKDKPGLEGLKYLELTNPTGGVQINEGEKINYDNWITSEALKIYYSLVKGTVYEKKNGEDVPASNATVKIKSSDGSILETKTDSNGEYKIDYVKGGLHSIAAVNEDASITKENSFYLSLDDIENKGKVLDIYLDRQIKIESPENTNIIIDGLEAASEGKNANVTISQPSLDETAGELITEAEKKLNASALYTLDIKLELENSGNQTNLNSPISFTFPIPDSDNKKDSDYYIYHIHNDGAETQTLYDTDNDPDTITIKTDKLSQFVLMQSQDTSDKIETDVIQSIKQQVEQQITKAVEEAEKQVAESNPSTPTPTPSVPTPTPGTPTPSVPTPTPGTPTPSPESPSPAPGSPSPTPSAPADNTPKPTTPPSNNNNSNSSGSPSTDGTPTPAPTPDVNKDNEKEQAKKELENITVPAKINMYTGQVKSIKPENLPDGAKVTYKSSKKSVADVKAGGKITVKKTGKAVITTTVTYKEISQVYKTAITVKKPYIDIKAKKTTMKVGQVYQFKAKVYGSSGKIVWSVSDKSKASINKSTGKLKAKKAGKITVYAKSGKITKKITVKIKA